MSNNTISEYTIEEVQELKSCILTNALHMRGVEGEILDEDEFIPLALEVFQEALAMSRDELEKHICY